MKPTSRNAVQAWMSDLEENSNILHTIEKMKSTWERMPVP